MKLSEFIVLAQLKLQQHGDLDMLTEEMYSISGLSHNVSDGSLPEDWHMPEGYEYITVDGVN